MGKLSGKVAVVTGGSTGIGFSTAQQLAAEGAHVYIMGRRASELDAAARAIGSSATAVKGDVARIADLDALYARVKDERGYVDVVFANAGVLDLVPLEQLTEGQLDRTLSVNVRGLVFTVQKALPLMRDGGSIVLSGSISANQGGPGSGLYSASKAAVRAFSRAWAAELASRKIRVNTLSPGPTDTPFLAANGFSEAQVAEATKQLVERIPLARWGHPDEVARAAVFLASDDSSFITGAELCVDGGFAQV